METLLKKINEAKVKLNSLTPLPPVLLQNLDEWFTIELTYSSNAIEGNTLTRQETSLVVKEGLTVEGKTLREHLEAINHVEAFKYLKNLVHQKLSALKESHILKLHQILLDKIDDTNAGQYRNVAVRIAGSTTILPNPVKVPTLMNEFIAWLKTQEKVHPAQLAADAHYKFVSIHPFVDGNGRCGRFLMNFFLMKNGYPPAIIKKEERKKYLQSLEKAQTTRNFDDYYKLLFNSVLSSLNIYIEQAETKKNETDKLFKIGELSKKPGESTAPLRFWIKEGLLSYTKTTESGYQLFNAAAPERAALIRKLQTDNRLTLAEIKHQLRKMI